MMKTGTFAELLASAQQTLDHAKGKKRLKTTRRRRPKKKAKR